MQWTLEVKHQESAGYRVIATRNGDELSTGFYKSSAEAEQAAKRRIDGAGKVRSLALNGLLNREHFKDCTLAGFSFQGFDLSNSVFENCDLRGCDFRDCNLENARLLVCDLRAADFSTANMTGIDLTNSIYSG